MNDRELLESAAKAAGIRLHVWGTKGAENFAALDAKTHARWNPLADDGDALRLAVKLRLIVDTDYNIGAAAGSAFLDMDCCYEADNPKRFGADRNAATRRAIVRAAAEIGRGMK